MPRVGIRDSTSRGTAGRRMPSRAGRHDRLLAFQDRGMMDAWLRFWNCTVEIAARSRGARGEEWPTKAKIADLVLNGQWRNVDPYPKRLRGERPEMTEMPPVVLVEMRPLYVTQPLWIVSFLPIFECFGLETVNFRDLLWQDCGAWINLLMMDELVFYD